MVFEDTVMESCYHCHGAPVCGDLTVHGANLISIHPSSKDREGPLPLMKKKGFCEQRLYNGTRSLTFMGLDRADEGADSLYCFGMQCRSSAEYLKTVPAHLHKRPKSARLYLLIYSGN